MSPSSESGRAGPFFIHIEGLPSNYTWKDLKDLIRERAYHGVWTDMVRFRNQPSDQGFARIKREGEARSLFEGLCSRILINKDLRVHLWDISKSKPEFMKCNCAGLPRLHDDNSAYSTFAKFAGDPRYWNDRESPEGSPSYPSQRSNSYAMPQSTPQQSIVAPFQSLQIQPQPVPNVQQQPQYSAVRVQQPYAQIPRQAPSSTLTSGGVPINVSQGYAVTENRGIHVSKLDYKLSPEEIYRYFSKAGKIVECEPAINKATGENKGYAVVRYSTAMEAQKAIEQFHGQRWKGQHLRVRLDRNATVVRAPPATSSARSGARGAGTPVIVNGSSGHQVR